MSGGFETSNGQFVRWRIDEMGIVYERWENIWPGAQSLSFIHMEDSLGHRTVLHELMVLAGCADAIQLNRVLLGGEG